ncbi:calcium-dependent protein kinase [Seminavis robusta]|uniref:Calcium-dependent protein kinase n=1 Tax=Seminavis robusta TaxID=568900 RepID=A0A9N8H0K7_9STRA|nr:calcium-dependent protein kinase [Seminavis robusta]|eukprot:Sro3_g002610.1 calcium-dependent protein kinase (273) ;mRNA; r:205926-206883
MGDAGGVDNGALAIRNGPRPMVTASRMDVSVNYLIDDKEPAVNLLGLSGTVRKCKHRETGKLCSLKSVEKKNAPEIEIFKREIIFHQQVKHKRDSTVGLVDVYEDEQYLHLVTVENEVVLTEDAIVRLSEDAWENLYEPLQDEGIAETAAFGGDDYIRNASSDQKMARCRSIQAKFDPMIAYYESVLDTLERSKLELARVMALQCSQGNDVAAATTEATVLLEQMIRIFTGFLQQRREYRAFIEEKRQSTINWLQFLATLRADVVELAGYRP